MGNQMDPTIVWMLLCTVISSGCGIYVGFEFVKRIEAFRRLRSFHEKVLKTTSALDAIVTERLGTSGKEKLASFLATTADERFSVDARHAIGLGLITEADVGDIGKDTIASSNLSFGLIVPISLFMNATAFRMQFWIYGLIAIFCLSVLFSFVLTVVGFERLISYKLRLQSMILGAFEKDVRSKIEALAR